METSLGSNCQTPWLKVELRASYNCTSYKGKLMTERVDRLEAQQDTNTANITDLITLSGNLLKVAEGNMQAIERLEAKVDETSTNVQSLRESVAANEERFNILIQEMRADRAEWQAKSEANRERFNILIQEMRADRAEWQARFSEQNNDG